MKIAHFPERVAWMVLLLVAGVQFPLWAATPVSVGDAQEVTIAVTGDIVAGTACKEVSDAILADKRVKAVILVGDTCNMATTPLEKYEAIYKGTYDRFMERIYPCPGNHDQQSSPPFSGYIAFWKEKAHAPELYYSFDLGGWHFVSLDSVTYCGGKEAAAKQLEWLKKDLAAKPGVPVVAFWHYPFVATARHYGEKKMKPVWEALYAHGPALVFCGHNHVYERFDPIDSEANNVAPQKGITEFEIGPGGAYATKEQIADALPRPVIFHGGAQHVGFFTLSPDGRYRFTVSSVGKGGKLAEVDSGVGKIK